MNKDPAVLFYTSDFLTGTMLMSNAQVGAYIRLLCLQHQQGHLSEKDMLKICGKKDAEIFEKFQRDEKGLYFNKRMEFETERRNAYVDSRRTNRLKKKDMNEHMLNHMTEHMNNHMCEHMENENENIDIDIINTLKLDKKTRGVKGGENAAIDLLFEKLWLLYPRKLGKGKISDATKRRLFAVGEEKLVRCIERFKADMEAQGRPLDKMPYGSTFFNSGYQDYLADDYETPDYSAPEETPRSRYKDLREGV